MKKATIISAVFIKEWKDVLKNKMFILTFFMFPVLSFLFKAAMPEETLAMTLPIFITMHIIMMPLLNMSSVISEEKENHTLRVLILSNVSPVEYLVGTGFCILIVMTASNFLFLPILALSLANSARFLAGALLGNICSLVMGSILGVLAKNQMTVSAVASPMGVILGMLPMFSTFQPNLYKISRFFYSQVISDMIKDSDTYFTAANLLIIGCNFAVLIVVFCMVYKRKHLDG